MTSLRTLAIPMIALSAPMIFSACSSTPPANVAPTKTTQVSPVAQTTPTTKTEPTGGMVMTNGEDDHHIDITSESQFLTVMIPHHEEAVMTANIIAEKSTNTHLKKLAKTIISDQTKEIEMMK